MLFFILWGRACFEASRSHYRTHTQCESHFGAPWVMAHDWRKGDSDSLLDINKLTLCMTKYLSWNKMCPLSIVCKSYSSYTWMRRGRYTQYHTSPAASFTRHGNMTHGGKWWVEKRIFEYPCCHIMLQVASSHSDSTRNTKMDNQSHTLCHAVYGNTTTQTAWRITQF